MLFCCIQYGLLSWSNCRFCDQFIIMFIFWWNNCMLVQAAHLFYPPVKQMLSSVRDLFEYREFILCVFAALFGYMIILCTILEYCLVYPCWFDCGIWKNSKCLLILWNSKWKIDICCMILFCHVWISDYITFDYCRVYPRVNVMVVLGKIPSFLPRNLIQPYLLISSCSKWIFY